MEKYLSTLKNTALFFDFTNEEILSVLHCLSAKKITYTKDEAVLLAGNKLSQIGIVLEGSLKIERDDINGEVIIIDEISKSGIFGEAFVCGDVKEIPVSIWATINTLVLYIDYKKILNVCSSACSHHINLTKNMLKLMANKLLMLNEKINIIQQKSIREKIIAYLKVNALKNKSNSFNIGFNRSELANYIGVNRSAMSRELGKMQKEGIIDFSKNHFKLNLI